MLQTALIELESIVCLHGELRHVLTTRTTSCRALYLVHLPTDIVDDPHGHPAMLKSGDFYTIINLNSNRVECEMTHCIIDISASFI